MAVLPVLQRHHHHGGGCDAVATSAAVATNRAARLDDVSDFFILFHCKRRRELVGYTKHKTRNNSNKQTADDRRLVLDEVSCRSGVLVIL